jgi:cytochrome oxidase Cu insertion factor (SCO1/SenC/PrrC family)
MPGKFTRTIELTTNIAIITVAILLGIVLVKNYLLAGPKQDPSAPPTVPVGTKISLQDVNWGAKKRTLLMALSDTCRYCTESADFYKKLAQEKTKHDDVRIIAVLPQDVSAGQAYLNKLGVVVDEVRQSPLDAVGVKATPTLIIIDDKGVVTASWVGKLPPEKETEVINHFLVNQATRLYDPNGVMPNGRALIRQ